MLHHAFVLRSLLSFSVLLAGPLLALAQPPGSVVPRLPPSDLFPSRLPFPPPVPAPDQELAGPPYVPDVVPDMEADAEEPDDDAVAPVEGVADPLAVVPVPLVVGAEDSLSLARRAAALLRGVVADAEEVDLSDFVSPDGFVSQSLARAVFAAPVAGSIPYILHAEVYHDLTLVFPFHWRVVDVHVGDPDRWAVSRSGHLIMLKPGEIGTRTNLTAVFDNGDILQMDLQEVTGMPQQGRTGRVYVGPERWLVDRIFGMLPLDVRARVARSPATIAELLADPVTVVGLYGGTGAVPNPLGSVAVSQRRPGRALSSVVTVPTLASLDGVDQAADAGPAPLAPPSSVPDAPAPLSTDGPSDGLPGAGRWVDGGAVRQLEADLRAAVDRVESSRIAGGDRVASAQLNVESDMDALRAEYPLRTQFSYLLDPDVDPYMEPFWHFGVWHDGERTFVRLLADDPQFVDEDTGEVVTASVLRDYLYRFDRLVENGSVIVHEPDGGPPRTLYFRRRRELEGP